MKRGDAQKWVSFFFCAKCFQSLLWNYRTTYLEIAEALPGYKRCLRRYNVQKWKNSRLTARNARHQATASTNQEEQ